MFLISEKFKSAVKSNTRKYEWHGDITTKVGKVYEFGGDDIVKGSGYIRWQCCSNTEIELGTVYAAELGISLYLDIDRYTLEDAKVRVYYTLTLADGTTETIPMGIYEISEANRGIRTLEIKAYDYMLRFEKTLNLESSSGTAYQFLKVACDTCKVELGSTLEEITALPNGETTLGIYHDNDIETYRDLIFYVAQVLGCFCQIDRYGKLVLKQYGNKPVWTVPQKERFDSNYSDFVTRYTAVSSTNKVDQTSEYIAMETDDALTMNLGTNPLMQFGLKATREKMLRNILVALQKVNYVPFDSTTIGNPALEPGDILKFTGGHADENEISCITSLECKMYGKMTIKCVGKNPRLASSKSKNEKNITGLLNSVESGKTIVYSFVNVSPFGIEQSLTKVMDIDFTATEDTTAAFHCEMLLEVIKGDTESEEYPELTIVYKMNDETIDTFMPTKTCMYGKHIVTLFLPISKVIEHSSNTFSMYLKISEGSASIGETQIRATLSGQGLAAGLGEWNGRININQNIGDVYYNEEPFVVDEFSSAVAVVFPVRDGGDFIQPFGDIAYNEENFTVDGFTERLWIAEILRSFTLTSVRGRPKYGEYMTINSEEQFTLRKRYSGDSAPCSMDLGFVEELVLDTSFYDAVEDVEIHGVSQDFRYKYVLDVKNSSITTSEDIEMRNGRFELVPDITDTKNSVESEIDEGYLQSIDVDISEYDGVKGVIFEI